MAELLRDRRGRGGRADRLAVRGVEFDHADPEVEHGSSAGRAFSTPTILHFCAVLTLAGILSAPWERIGPAALSWGALGAGGLVYTSMVIRRIRAQKAYRPELEDWLFHAALPMVGYLALAVLAVAARSRVQEALFGVGAAALLLLLCGIHNAWDAVTYHVFSPSERA